MIEVVGLNKLVAELEALKRGFGEAQSWQVGPEAEYAGHVEFGTSRQRAQPYMRPAVSHAVSVYATLVSSAVKTDTPAQTLIKLLALAIERQAKQDVPVDTGKLRASITVEAM